MKIGYIGGFWSTNIGNSFYNIGMLWLLRSIFGEKDVYFIPDPPQVNWPALKNDFALIGKLDIDLYIISGPILGFGIERIYSKIFDEIAKKGGRIGFISVGACEYTEEEARFVANFLKDYNPEFIFTRDSQTYKLYENKLDTFMYDGLCTSMYLNDAYSPIEVKDDYVVTNFSYLHEPRVTFTDGDWGIKSRVLLRKQNELLGFPIVRLQSKGIVPNFSIFKTKNLVFTRDNMYYSDLPYGYLSILKSAKYVFSDRVHTCAAGLIYGTPCMYVKGQRRSKDGRNNLFLRLGVPDIYHQPAMLDMEYIDNEKRRMKEVLAFQMSSSNLEA